MSLSTLGTTSPSGRVAGSRYLKGPQVLFHLWVSLSLVTGTLTFAQVHRKLCCPFASWSVSSSLSPQMRMVSPSLGGGRPVQMPLESPIRVLPSSGSFLSPWPENDLSPLLCNTGLCILFCSYHILPLISYLCVGPVSPTRL